jgi:thiol:disulfide interchange protein DsbD
MINSALLSLWLSVAISGSPAQWSFTAVQRTDGMVELRCQATLEEGWHLYATTLPSDEGPIPTSIRLKDTKAFTLVSLQEPTPVEEYDPNFAMVVRHHSGTPSFVLLLKPNTKAPLVVEGEVEFMLCNDKTCLPPVGVPFKVDVATDPKK